MRSPRVLLLAPWLLGLGCGYRGGVDDPIDQGPPRCGDGACDPGEACDDGNTRGGDGCEADCTLPPGAAPACGNKIPEAGEACYLDAREYPTGDEPGSAQAVDLDGEGDLDIAVSSWSLYALRNGGDGALEGLGAVAPGDDSSAHDSRWDFDGDGLPEIVDHEAASGRLFVYANGSGMRFAPAAAPVIDGYVPGAWAFGDFDGDGDGDLVVTAFLVGGGDRQGVYLLRNRGGVAFGAPEPIEEPAEAEETPLVAAAGDIDGDGDADFVAGGFLFSNDGGARFSKGGLPAGAATWERLAFRLEAGSSAALLGGPYGDFDGDGDLDRAEADGDAVSVSRYEGAGVFGAPARYELGGGPAFALGVGYFNADTAPDLAAWDTRRLLVLLNDGSGGFAAPRELFAVEFPEARYLAVGDLNGDYISDIVSTHQGPPGGVLYVSVVLSDP